MHRIWAVDKLWRSGDARKLSRNFLELFRFLRVM